MPLAAIAEEEGLNPTMLSRIIGTLESKGLVERLRAPEDKRAVTVAATPEGARLQERIRDERVGTILDAAALLSPNQRKAINSSLEALEALIKAMP
jgi:DNA-binding MarR family transcriptional regulator